MPKAAESASTIRTSSLERAHCTLIAHLATRRPIRIRGSADLADLHNVVDHLRDVFGAITAYMDAVVADTTDHLSLTRTNRAEVEALLFHMVNEGDLGRLGVWLADAGCHLELPAQAA